MKHLELPCFGIKISFDSTGGTINSDLHEDFPPKIGPDYDGMEDEIISIAQYNTAIDAIESMILGHVISGVDVSSPAYLEGIETAVQSVANNL